MAYFLEARDVSFQYLQEAGHPTLEHVNLAVEQGKTTVLIGASGCGKSTLAMLAAGVYPENGGKLLGGELCALGKRVDTLQIAQRVKLLGVMFQNPDLQFCMDTLRKELIFCLENLAYDPARMDGAVEAFAREYAVEPLLDRSFSSLSGGEKQKAALCCLLLLGSEGLVLDEPFANLDPASARQVTGFLRTLRGKRPLSLLVIDHRLDHWLELADEIIVLGTGGRVVAGGITPETLSNYRALFEAEGLFYPEPLPPFAPRLSGGPEALRLENVGLAYGERTLLQNASCTFARGSLNAILGPSGAGKTTLFSAILGQKKYTGSIWLNGREVRAYRRRERFAAVGAVFQNPANQFVALNVLSEVQKSLEIWQPGRDVGQTQRQALEILARYGLEKYRNYSPYMLSQGQQRRLAVASALAGGQGLLLLDEPTYGQDRRSTDAIMEQLRTLCGAGLTVLFSTHDVQTALRYSDTIYELQERGLAPWRG